MDRGGAFSTDLETAVASLGKSKFGRNLCDIITWLSITSLNRTGLNYMSFCRKSRFRDCDISISSVCWIVESTKFLDGINKWSPLNLIETCGSFIGTCIIL